MQNENIIYKQLFEIKNNIIQSINDIEIKFKNLLE